MLFTAPIFLFYFLPLALLWHRWAVRGSRGAEYPNRARAILFLLTLVFYGAQHPWWLLPLGFTIGMDFIWAAWLGREERDVIRHRICVISIFQNVSLLILFKYWHLIGPLLARTPGLGSLVPGSWLGIKESILPAGISFYAFESMSFVIDVYRRDINPPRKPLEFFAFIGMFPRFVAGPIVRYKEMAAQFRQYRGMDIEGGLFLFAVGFVLKACFADSFAAFVPYAFERTGEIDFVSAWIGSVSYTMQIYFDFSGYSMMAIGLGRCLGFTFPTNFNRPYLATSLQDFWRRWHISLSSWLRDYLYISLGGSRGGKWKTYRNLFLTMLIGGAWHGAGATFLIWGAWHGLFLGCERAFLEGRAFPTWFRRLLTGAVVVSGWVFFRAANVGEAAKVLRAMVYGGHSAAAFNPEAIVINPLAVAFVLIGFLYCFWGETRIDEISVETISRYSFFSRAVGAVAFGVALIVALSEWSVPFLYFQF